MPSVPPPHLLLFAADPGRQDLRAVLDDAGYDIDARSLDAEPANGKPAGLLVVDALHQPEQALRLCNRLRSAQQELFVPILFVANGDPRVRALGLDGGADAFLTRPIDAAELLAQVAALLRIKDRHAQLSARAAESGRR